MSKKNRAAHIVVDLGFGDQGKGTMTDWLARQEDAHTVIRYNGGSQAAHNVIDPTGRHHTFSQFGSATFRPGVRTHLSRFMIVNPPALLIEGEVLQGKGVDDAFDRITVSEDALVVTPFQVAANRLRELARSEGRHGSCGMGIGETASDSLVLGRSVLRVGDLRDRATRDRKLAWMMRHKREHLAESIAACRRMPDAENEIAILESSEPPASYLAQLDEFARHVQIVPHNYLRTVLRQPGNVVFEGSQGVLLDEWRGFHPFTTWSNCTADNAMQLLDECGYDGDIVKVGVIRGYGTRHGPGPFVTEDAELTTRIPDMHNRMDAWQRAFRVGWFDAVATRYAVAACGGVDELAVTCMDRLTDEIDESWPVCDDYRLPSAAPPSLAQLFVPSARDARFVHDIRLGPQRDLSYQQELTGALGQVEPLYVWHTRSRTTSEDAERHLDLIGKLVGADVRYVSSGPTANDKRKR